ncbi:MAG TPA: FAD-dependent oxidoreductase [Ferruginibacter sp.]|nr:FAD-dependent oxidoreductase [Ferruginibacter sp.]
MKKHISKHFKNPRLQQLLEFPVLFLGALPENTPALYSLMNYADIKLGTWYPHEGMYKIVEGMFKLAEESGVKFFFNNDVNEIRTEAGRAKQVIANKVNVYEADVVIGAADYHFIENNLLPENCRTYSEQYWDNRVMAPSCLLYYIGLNKKLEGVLHHSLFFDSDFEIHGKEIYTIKQWPSDPLFYVCTPSVTDKRLHRLVVRTCSF